MTGELAPSRTGGRARRRRLGRRPALAWAFALLAVAGVFLAVRALGGAQAILGVDQVTTGPAAALQGLAGVLPFGYALGAGMLAAINPCGFALLPAYLGLYLGSSEPRTSSGARLGRALRVALTMSAAFVLTFGVVGVLVGGAAAAGAAGAAAGPALPVIGLLVGLGLAAAGAHVLAGGHLAGGLGVRLGDRATARLAGAAGSGGTRGYAAYGIAYAAASLGCALPIFLTVVGLASATHDPVRSAGQLALYGVGMGLVVSALTVAAALLEGALLARVREVADRLLTPVTGALLVLTGAYVTAYWLTLGFQ